MRDVRPEEVERDMKKDTALETIYNEVKFQSEVTHKTKVNLDSKAINLLGFTGVIISICFALGLFAIDRPKNEPLYDIFVVFFLLSVLSLFCSVFFSILNIRLQKYKAGPVVDELRKDILEDKEAILKKLLNTHLSDFEYNRKQNDDKVKLFKCSFYLIVAGIAFLGISLIILVVMML